MVKMVTFVLYIFYHNKKSKALIAVWKLMGGAGLEWRQGFQRETRRRLATMVQVRGDRG